MPHATIVLEDPNGRQTVVGRVAGGTFFKTFTWGQTFRRRWYLTRDQMQRLNLLNKKATNQRQHGGTA